MNKSERDRVVFQSIHDMSSSHYLTKAEPILNSDVTEDIDDINDILELYNISLFFDNGVYLKSWSDTDFATYKEKVDTFKSAIVRYISNVDDSNFLSYFENIHYNYYESFWELINKFKRYKNISPSNIEAVLKKKPHQIRYLLSHKKIVSKYNRVLCNFLKEHQKSAEILLSIYEVENSFNKNQLYLPSFLTIQDKENIISSYIDSENCNTSYLPIIQNAKKNSGFRISDKTKLKAKRKYQQSTKDFFDNGSSSSIKYGVAISYPENATKVKHAWIEQDILHYEFSLDHIKDNNHPYILYENFKTVFEYMDEQNIIALTSKENQLGILERILGVRSKTEYVYGVAFTQLEMASMGQIYTYTNVLKGLGHSLENILKTVFNNILPKLYDLPSNINLTVPTENASALEKVRTIAPEFESILKQYKLFVENEKIDFEFLQMSSGPTAIKDIPSLNVNKYIYIRKDEQKNKILNHLLFSDQTLLTYVEPFKDKKYKNFVDLLVNEEEINFGNYEEYQYEHLNYLIDENYISINTSNLVDVTNWNRILILRDIFENEVASFYHYPADIQEEVINMSKEGIVYFGSSLFAESEQNYFNYYLNKSDFTNGLDLRNSYLHGTQANPTEIHLHENSYLLYLKLLTLVILKIEDDLFIFNKLKTNSE
tara:strand:- start:494 stop:2464 length:1971 start_codon:yes stop_codon:yes gene_type:complete